MTHPPIRLAESSAKVINVFEMSKWWRIFYGDCVFAFSVIWLSWLGGIVFIEVLGVLDAALSRFLI